MAEDSNISWTDHTFNPWIGCSRVSAGCQNCYAEAQDVRWRGGKNWGKNADRQVTSDANWRKPLAWDRAAAEAGRPALVFCGSLCDVFEARDDLDEVRERLWRLIKDTPHLIWLLLTKRPENVMRMVPIAWTRSRRLPNGGPVANDRSGWWPRNVWIGTTVEDQAAADERLPILARIPTPVRFLSCEPLLGPVDLLTWGECTNCHGTGREPSATWNACNYCQLHPGRSRYMHPDRITAEWVIAGGESGPGRRLFDPSWALDIRDQCTDAGVPFFYKQGSDAKPGSDPLLDGKQYHNWPKEAQR